MTMDINLVRSLMTLVMFCVFVAIVGWAWSGRQRGRFAEAARIPLEDERAPTTRGGE
jgi:cytochrome c oxidase cbb3-type subunit 4